MVRKLFGVALLAGCASVVDVGLVATLVGGDAVVSPATPGMFTVTARNTSGQQIVWGQGSSSCQLSLWVGRDPGQSIDFRMCTQDFVDQGLNAFEEREETFEWDGTVLMDGEPVPLPEGEYEIFGKAGDQFVSGPVTVRVRH